MSHLDNRHAASIWRPYARGLKPERGAGSAVRRSAAQPRLILGRRNSAILRLSVLCSVG
jgi:hypothetical protein